MVGQRPDPETSASATKITISVLRMQADCESVHEDRDLERYDGAGSDARWTTCTGGGHVSPNQHLSATLDLVRFEVRAERCASMGRDADTKCCHGREAFPR